MYSKSKLKRYFIIAVITSMSFSALVGIIAVLTASFGELQSKILLSTMAIGLFSITSLANLRNLESEHASYRLFAWLSIILSMVAMVFVVIMIWSNFGDNTPWKPLLTSVILAVSTAHASLVLSSRGQSKYLDIAVTTTLACIAFVAGFLIYLVIAQSEIGEIFYRLLAVFAILDVLGTVVVPVLTKVSKPKQNNTSPPTAQPPAAPSNNTGAPPPTQAQPPPAQPSNDRTPDPDSHPK